MKSALLALLFTATVYSADYLRSAIECAPDDEAACASVFDASLALLRGELVALEKYPSRLVTRTEAGVIISRSFYVTPNEMRGFEIFIPNGAFRIENEYLQATGLKLEEHIRKQGISILRTNIKNENGA